MKGSGYITYIEKNTTGNKVCNWWGRVIINKRSNHWLNKKASPSNLYFNTIQHQMTVGRKTQQWWLYKDTCSGKWHWKARGQHTGCSAELAATAVARGPICAAPTRLSWAQHPRAGVSGSWCLTTALGISNLFAHQQQKEAQSGRSLMASNQMLLHREVLNLASFKTVLL